MLRLRDIETDDVALFDGSDRTAHRRFRSNVADTESARSAAEAAIGDERHVFR